MLVGVDASGSAEQIDLGNGVRSSASGQPEESQRHSCPPSRVSNHVESQPSTQTTANEINPPLPSGPHLEVDQLIRLDVPHVQGTKNGTNGIKGRNASLLTFNKKKGALETLKRNRPLRDSQVVGDAEQVLGLSESTGATVAEQTRHGDAEPHLIIADYEEQDQACPASPNIE